MIQNKKIILVIFFLLILLSCKTNQTEIEEKNSNRKIEGWGGSPDSPNQKPFDYFYMKTTGRASDSSLKKRNPYLIKSSCIKASNDFPEFKYFMAQLISNNLESCSGTSHNPQMVKSFLKKFNKEFNEIKILNCIPLYTDEKDFPNSRWKECECVAYTKILGGKETVKIWEKEYKY